VFARDTDDSPYYDPLTQIEHRKLFGTKYIKINVDSLIPSDLPIVEIGLNYIIIDKVKIEYKIVSHGCTKNTIREITYSMAREVTRSIVSE
jgi:hypothetical protein